MNFIKLDNFIFKNIFLSKHGTKKAYIFLKKTKLKHETRIKIEMITY